MTDEQTDKTKKEPNIFVDIITIMAIIFTGISASIVSQMYFDESTIKSVTPVLIFAVILFGLFRVLSIKKHNPGINYIIVLLSTVFIWFVSYTVLLNI